MDDQKLKPLLPLKTRITLFFLSAVTDASSRPDGTVNRRFFSMVESLSCLRVPANPKPRNGVKTSDVTVDSSRNLWIRLFIPIDSAPRLPVVVFFHGGGFVYLSPDARVYDEVCRRFARKIPAVVVSVNYRLAPEHRYPAQYDDGYDVLKFLDEQRHVILPENADLSRCFLAGDSAGGNLAHHVTLQVARCSSPFAHLKAINFFTSYLL